ncbi:MAG: acyl-CoA thioesterase [Hyphomicrobiaceae bacterium]|nr:acyl-CoA thioesterase [Hyphomicrobiaceae bacterium]
MNETVRPIDLTRRETFDHWTSVTIRFSDQDPLGHVNNVAIASYVEASRTMLIRPFLLQEKYPELDFALVHLEIDYKGEFTYPGTVDVGGRIARLGRKSFTTAYGLFVDDACVATAGSVNCFFDTSKRQGVTPPDDVRTLFERRIAAQPV